MSNLVKADPSPPASEVVTILERALSDPSIDVVKARELWQFSREIRAELAENAFNEAMRYAQAEMGPVRTNAANPQTRSKYASLSALDNVLRPIYTKHGFALSYDTADAPNESSVRIICLVTCANYTRSYHIDMPADGKGAKGGDVMTRTHATGSAVTYGRRYLLLMIFNIAVAGDDDDGNHASGPTVAAMSPEQRSMLVQKSTAKKCPAASLIKHLNSKQLKGATVIKSIDDIPAARFQEAMDDLDLWAVRK
jgi:ERF superfamily